MKPRVYEQHFRQNRLPHLWCPGCGNGIVMKAIVEAIVKKNLDPYKNSNRIRYWLLFTCIWLYGF